MRYLTYLQILFVAIAFVAIALSTQARDTDGEIEERGTAAVTLANGHPSGKDCCEEKGSVTDFGYNAERDRNRVSALLGDGSVNSTNPDDTTD